MTQATSTIRTARAPTDLKPNLIRVEKRDDKRADRREGSERVKELQHVGDLRSSRRPPAHEMRRKDMITASALDTNRYSYF